MFISMSNVKSIKLIVK